MGAVAKAPQVKPGRTRYRYQPKSSLLTPSEASFYRALELAVGHRFVVFAKVRMLDLCDELEKRTNVVAFNQVVSKHVDFVLCDPESFRPVLIVELDDHWHFRPDRRARDAFVDEVFETMGVGLLHQLVRRFYDVSWIARRVDAALL